MKIDPHACARAGMRIFCVFPLLLDFGYNMTIENQGGNIMKLSVTNIKEFGNYLRREEKSIATQEKYLRDAQSFYVYADGSEISKELVIAWKQELITKEYAVRSVNSMLASINSLLDFLGLSNCKVKNIRTQR